MQDAARRAPHLLGVLGSALGTGGHHWLTGPGVTGRKRGRVQHASDGVGQDGQGARKAPRQLWNTLRQWATADTGMPSTRFAPYSGSVNRAGSERWPGVQSTAWLIPDTVGNGTTSC